MIYVYFYFFGKKKKKNSSLFMHGNLGKEDESMWRIKYTRKRASLFYAVGLTYLG